MSTRESILISPPLAPTAKGIEWLDRALIYGSVALIPYDLPVFHEACLPLAGFAGLLMLLRNDTRQFLEFLRRLPLLSSLGLVVCLFSVLSLYGNLHEILDSTFQQETGWQRGVQQAVLLFVNFYFPFYLAFCLRRHADWQAMLIRAAWWSLPIPLLVGFFQFANWLGVPGTSHLPYVTPFDRGVTVFRITTVARESSWFGSFTCVVMPFLIMGIKQIESRLVRWAGIGATAVVLLFCFLGFSKSAFAGLAGEIAIAVGVALVVRKPWRAALKCLYLIMLLCTIFLGFSIVAPQQADRISRPFINEATDVYNVFEPLLVYNKKFVDISTRFGMLDAGTAMAKDHPVIGVGLGQFGFHAYNYLPLWGFNGETANWVANDTNAWPSTSNLYGRLLAETGLLGTLAYLAFRLLIMAAMIPRLLRKSGSDWPFDLSIFSILAALFVFDFHRDSFINMDMWTALGVALACLSGPVSEGEPDLAAVRGAWKLSGIVATTAFCMSFAWLLLLPNAYRASATIIPKSNGVFVTPDTRADGSGPSVNQTGSIQPDARFELMRSFLPTRTVGARMIAAHGDLVHAALKKDRATPAEVAQYIKENVVILMADNQTTLTLQYLDSDPKLATRFLTAAIEETDQAVTSAATAVGRQATQLSSIALQRGLDSIARTTLLNTAAAQELEGSFNTAGTHANFDYVDQPMVLQSDSFPPPGASIVFIFILAALTGAIAVVTGLLWPSFIQGLGRRSPFPRGSAG